MSNIIIHLQDSHASKTELKISINLISSKDSEEVCLMDLQSNNIRFTYYNCCTFLSHLFQDIKAISISFLLHLNLYITNVMQ